MRAAVRDRFGPPDVVEVRDVEPPDLVDDGVLVRVYASSINKADWYELTGTPWIGRFSMGLRRPKTPRLGSDFAGVVEAVGSDVTDFKVGDRVYGGRSGAYGEYVVVKNAVTLMPDNLDFAQAGTVATAAITALQGLRDHAQVVSGHRVLVNGASGGVGTFSIQVAKALGAEVTAVCSAQNVEQAFVLGADHVFDYSREDFAQSGRTYDVVFDVAGSRRWADVRRVLDPGGVDVIVGAPSRNPVLGPLGFIIKTRLASIPDSRKSAFFIARFNRSDLEVLTGMMASGQITPLVERSFPLDEISEAYRAFGDGNRSKTVITI